MCAACTNGWQLCRARGSHAPAGGWARGLSWKALSARDRISHAHQSVCSRVRPVAKQADSFGGTCRQVEAWTAEISSNLDLETSDLLFGEERGGVWRSSNNCGMSMEARAMPEGLRLHRSTDPRPRHHFWWFFWPRAETVTTR